MTRASQQKSVHKQSVKTLPSGAKVLVGLSIGGPVSAKSTKLVTTSTDGISSSVSDAGKAPTTSESSQDSKTPSRAFYDKSVRRLTIDQARITPIAAMYDPRAIETLEQSEDLLNEIGGYIAKFGARQFAAGYNAALEDVREGRYLIENHHELD